MANDARQAAYLTDYWTLQDDLHFSDFRQALLRILTEAQTPLTVGVFGPWGSGKTSLLRMLKDKIDAESLHFVRTVWFTAWKYDRHEALWRTFILRVLDGLYPRVPGEGPWEERERIPPGDLGERQKAHVEHLDRLFSSLYGAVEWEELGRWVVEWEKTRKELAKLPAFLLLLSVGAKKVAKMLRIAPDMADLVRREAQSHRLEQLASMEQFGDTFPEALRLVLGDEGRLVVFVDDLDRCLPERAVEVLEAIKLFLEVPGTVFVLGMDREVIERGIEARYAAFFSREGEERPELPIRGDVYLQKIVQIPFHLPPLAVEDLGEYIQALEADVPVDARLSEMTRAVFAHGLFANPRQVKRALNIFRLLREIALAREERGSLLKGSVAWPLLAKTVLIQTQWPKLYQEWRQRPTLVQTLEDAYDRRPAREEDIVLGSTALSSVDYETATTGLLSLYLHKRHEYALLEQLLTFPQQPVRSLQRQLTTMESDLELIREQKNLYVIERDIPPQVTRQERRLEDRIALLRARLSSLIPVPEKIGVGRERTRFTGLTREEMIVYVRLAGAVGPEEPAVEVPGDLLAEMLSSDRARVQEAAARLEEQEEDRDGPQHRATREQLLRVMRDSARSVRERASAGDGLALVGDPRFRADAWYLPGESLLGFVEIPEGPFLMGSEKAHDPQAYDAELPQHEVTLSTYYIARYPVTAVQFRAFVQASGHQPEDLDSLRGLDNHPVVRVAWYEALKYCEWLTERLRAWEGTPEPLARLLREQGWAITLPSEAEWERAARGADGRWFPWGANADPNLANYRKTGILRTSAVGCFSGGASPFGVEDLSGNVWEWTRSLWGEDPQKPDFGYPYDPRDGREDLEAGRYVLRVLRGGAFDSAVGFVRCAYRNWDDLIGHGNFGFRVVASPAHL